MVDVDEIFNAARVAVDRFVFEECTVDLAPIRAHEGLNPLDEIVAAFGEWSLVQPLPNHPLSCWPIDQSGFFAHLDLMFLVVEHFLIRATSRVCKKYDAGLGRSRVFVNMELRHPEALKRAKAKEEEMGGGTPPPLEGAEGDGFDPHDPGDEHVPPADAGGMQESEAGSLRHEDEEATSEFGSAMTRIMNGSGYVARPRRDFNAHGAVL